jgi:hypothetical protein
MADPRVVKEWLDKADEDLHFSKLTKLPTSLNSHPIFLVLKY